ncbi:hypothetical protein DL96DRAFT_917712 [Flagelloscypha sp. PMI_526]|nr:hypothetical protein DL96DRAFT_917712 [Flagelloscypha sp. PMI_526]
MNRLNSLETNHTLYRRYFEDQMGMIREVVRRLGEEGGRREALTNAQTALLQKTIRDWERRRERLEGDYNELVGKVEKLADDIRLEKQLGIAQLTLLLLVLVFLGLTRGSNHEPLFTIDAHGRGRRWVGEFGRRTLSLGGFRSSRSQEKPGVSQKEADNSRQDPRHVAFPLTTSGNVDSSTAQVTFATCSSYSTSLITAPAASLPFSWPTYCLRSSFIFLSNQNQPATLPNTVFA